MNLVEPIAGKAKTGETTVALQFLLEGVKAGEKRRHITLSETGRELRDGAAGRDRLEHACSRHRQVAGRNRLHCRRHQTRRESGTVRVRRGTWPFILLRGVAIHVGESRPLLREQSK
jgi:hypothetical protein